MRRRTVDWRRLWRQVHLWLGLLLGGWLALIGATGSVLAWGPELIRSELLWRHPYRRQALDQPRLPLSQVVAALQQADPTIQLTDLRLIVIPNFRYPHFLVPLRRSGGIVYKIDPFDGTVYQPYRKTDLWIGLVSAFHENLLLGPRGLLLNGWCSALAVVLLGSGLWTWWPRSRSACWRSLRPRRGTPPRRQLLAWHNLGGLTGLPVLLLTTTTAVLLVSETITAGRLAHWLGEPAPVVPKPGRPRLGLDQLVATARAAVPDLPLVLVEPGFGSGEPFVAAFRSPRGWAQAAEVWLDPADARVLLVQRGDTASRGKRFEVALDDLHFGLTGGWVTKLLYTVGGLTPAGLFGSGLYLWWPWRRRPTAPSPSLG
ncbi:MAG: PepSY domain-containing protein [Fimbriimonadaceae bacterium]|nr:PepSY domain-containing protein [Fimbriimonadaceae bacterium]